MTRARVSSRNTRICGAGRAPGVRAKREARRHRERHARCLRPGGRRLRDGDTHRSWRQRRQGRSGRLRWQDDTPAQAWLAMRLGALPVDYLFVARSGTPLTRDYATHLLHRLSRRAGLPHKIGPHALRHYAATALLRHTGKLELVRQVLRHETLTMTLRYAHLADLEVAKQFRRASSLDRLSGEIEPETTPAPERVRDRVIRSAGSGGTRIGGLWCRAARREARSAYANVVPGGGFNTYLQPTPSTSHVGRRFL